MRSPLWLSLLLLGAAPSAHAATWVNVAEGSQSRSTYLDSDSLQRDGSQVQVWMREVFTQEQRSPHTGVLYYSANTLTRFECGKRTIAPLTRVFYGGDGTELRRVSLDQVELPALTTPGSIQERLLEEACRPPAAKKPSVLPTKLALADKPKTDLLPGAASEPAKASTDQDGAKPSAAGSVKPAPTAKPGKAAVEQTSSKPAGVKPTVDRKPAVVAKVPPQPIKPVAPEPVRPVVLRRYVERRAIPRPQRVRPIVGLVSADEEHALKPEQPAAEVHWSYEGNNGPQHWAELKPEFAACASGKRQSPIDIQDGARLNLEPIKFDYRPAPLRIVDNGHTVQVNYSEGSSISVAGVRYDLKQLHFHKPSEERVNGKMYDMVVHLVHQSAEGRLAVIAVLMEEGAHNDFLATLWPHLPLESGRELALPDVAVDVMTLLPESHQYYTYMGSLTTPPCTEGVLWLVMKTPVTVSTAQTAVFAKLYKMNARPVQASNGRLIKESL